MFFIFKILIRCIIQQMQLFHVGSGTASYVFKFSYMRYISRFPSHRKHFKLSQSVCPSCWTSCVRDSVTARRNSPLLTISVKKVFSDLFNQMATSNLSNQMAIGHLSSNYHLPLQKLQVFLQKCSRMLLTTYFRCKFQEQHLPTHTILAIMHLHLRLASAPFTRHVHLHLTHCTCTRHLAPCTYV